MVVLEGRGRRQEDGVSDMKRSDGQVKGNKQWILLHEIAGADGAVHSVCGGCAHRAVRYAACPGYASPANGAEVMVAY